MMTKMNKNLRTVQKIEEENARILSSSNKSPKTYEFSSSDIIQQKEFIYTWKYYFS